MVRAPLRLDVIGPVLLAVMLLPPSLVALAQTGATAAWVITAGVLFGCLHVISFFAPRRPRAGFVAASAVMLVLALLPLFAGVSAALYPSAIAYLVSVYQIAARDERRYAYAALAVAVTGSAIVAVTATDLVDPLWRVGAFLGLAAANAAAWAFGLVQRMRDARAAEREEERLREVRAAERTRISAELHDVVAHSLTVMLAQAAVARGFLREDADVSERALDIVLDSGRDALRGMRGIVREGAADDGARAPRAPIEGIHALDGLIHAARSPETTIDHEECGERRTLATPVQLTVLSAMREGLTNAIRHTAAPRTVRVRLDWQRTELTMTVDDDGGSGASGAGLGTGTGLLGLAERARLAGGSLESGRRPEGGWRLRVTLPVETLPAETLPVEER